MGIGRGSVYLGDADTPYYGGKLLHNLILFGRVCRALGMDITPHRMVEVAQALEYIQLGRREDVYYVMRALMVVRQRDLALFDEAFRLFWRRPSEEWTQLNLTSLGEERHRRKTRFLPAPESDADEEQEEAQIQADPALITIMPTYSQNEVLRNKDFANMSGEELEQARRIMTELPQSLGWRRSRRFAPGKGRHLDLRQLYRAALRHGGEWFDLPARQRKIKPRPVVLICDISGSMERYTQILLHFIHVLANTMYQVESFVFSTHLDRITHSIRQHSVDEALKRIGSDVKNWGGGTKTGASLKEFNQKWSRRTLGRGAIVMIITDGWDRGDMELLRKQMRRLRMSCYRFIWLNPLLGATDYEPLTQGAQGMLPYVDDFLPVHNLASLEILMNTLENLNFRRGSSVAHRRYIVDSMDSATQETNAKTRFSREAGEYWNTRRSILSDRFRRDFYGIREDRGK